MTDFGFKKLFGTDYRDIKNVVGALKEEGQKGKASRTDITGRNIKDIHAIRAEMNRTKD